MGQFIIFVALLGILPLALWFWAKRLKNLAVAITIAENERAQSQSNVEAEERVTNARLAFYRDLFLAILSVGSMVYFIFSLLSPALEGLAQYFSDIASALKAYEPLSKVGQMESIVNLLMRILLSIGAFLITFGMFVSFVPEIIPDKGTIRSNYISMGIAFCLAAAFALWLGTSTEALGIVLQQLTQGALGIIITFLSILFGAIGTYLLWIRIKTMIKPK